MKTGTVKLIYQEKAVMQSQYYSRGGREEILFNWRQLTGLNFDQCFIQIRPKVNGVMKKDNMKKIRNKKNC